MITWAASGLGWLAFTLQEPRAGGASSSEVLLYMGIGIIALLVFGFMLLRRGRQRPVASAFDDRPGNGGEQAEEQEGMEQVL